MQQRKPEIRQALEALDSADYRHFAIALLVFNFVTQITQVTTAWQIYDLTGSPLQVGLTGLARAIPQLTLSLVGGVIADRFDRVRLMMTSQAIIGVLILALALLTGAGGISREGGALAVW